MIILMSVIVVQTAIIVWFMTKLQSVMLMNRMIFDVLKKQGITCYWDKGSFVITRQMPEEN